MRQHSRPHGALTRPMTAFAVTVMLAACGGGGDDGNRAVSSTPAPNAQSNHGRGSSLTTNINVTAGAFAGSGAIAEAINHGTRPGAPTPAPVPAPSDTGTTATSPSASGNDSASQNPPASSGNDNQPPVRPAPGTGAETPPTAANPGNDANGNGAAAVEPTKPTLPAVVPLVSDAGVRGEVVLAMMDQRACAAEAVMHRTTSILGTDDPEDVTEELDTPPISIAAWLSSEAYTYDEEKWKIEGRHPPGRAPGFAYQCMYRDIRSYSNPVQPGNHTFSMRTGPMYFYFYEGPPVYLPSSSYPLSKGVNKLRAEYQVTVDIEQFSINGEAKIEQAEDLAFLAKTAVDNRIPNGRKVESSLTGDTRHYGRQRLVPFGALNQWQDHAGNHLQLLLIKADEPNSIRLCTHFDGVLAKRLHCVTWEVPSDWTWGRELLGGRNYLIDDRSVYANESGFLYWHSNPNLWEEREKNSQEAHSS